MQGSRQLRAAAPPHQRAAHARGHHACAGELVELPLPRRDLVLPHQLHQHLAPAGRAQEHLASAIAARSPLGPLVGVAGPQRLQQRGAQGHLLQAHKGSGCLARAAPKVLHPARGTVVLAARRIIPLHADPDAGLPLHLSDVAHGGLVSLPLADYGHPGTQIKDHAGFDRPRAPLKWFFTVAP